MSERRFAVLVGSSNYPDEPKLADLRCPAADVEGLAAALKREDRGGFHETVVLNDQPAHKVARAIQSTLNKSDKDDTVLIYFSGHGKLNRQGKLHLTTTDTVLTELEATSVPVSAVHNYIKVSNCNRVIWILDCCFAGAVGQEFKSSAGEELQQASGRGTYVLSASTGSETAAEQQDDDHSLFTKHLIDGIATGDADIDRNGHITIDELYAYAHKKVCEEGAQEPEKWDLGARGEMIIAASGKESYEERQDEVRDKLLNLASSGHIPDSIFLRANKINQLERSEVTDADRPFGELLDKFTGGALTSAQFTMEWGRLEATLSAGEAAELARRAEQEAAEARAEAEAARAELEAARAEAEAARAAAAQCEIDPGRDDTDMAVQRAAVAAAREQEAAQLEAAKEAAAEEREAEAQAARELQAELTGGAIPLPDFSDVDTGGGKPAGDRQPSADGPGRPGDATPSALWFMSPTAADFVRRRIKLLVAVCVAFLFLFIYLVLPASIEEVSLSPDPVTLAIEGYPYALDTYVEWSADWRWNAGYVSPSSFTWDSTNPSVAIVDWTGTVTPLSPGETTISASYNGYNGYSSVTVISENEDLFSPGIGPLNATVDHLLFWEEGEEDIPYEQRRYSTDFDRLKTRYIGLELGLSYAEPGRTVDMPVACVVAYGKGIIAEEANLEVSVEPSWSLSSHSYFLGSGTAGAWQAGDYVVDCSYQGSPIASATFSVR